jgi:Mg-chelatase subunit ChlD
VDLQAAVKHGNCEAASPGQRGEQRWRYEYNGVVYITDASSKQEITSWRLDGKDVIKDARMYGTHIVLVVDNSGSMRSNDVSGYRSRTDAVYASLLRDLVFPQLKH